MTYYPEDLRQQIDDFHAWVYPNINNGVYRSGFATATDAYLEAVLPLFEALDRVDKLIGDKPYVMGDRLTEADVRLFTYVARRSHSHQHYCPIRPSLCMQPAEPR